MRDGEDFLWQPYPAMVNLDTQLERSRLCLHCYAL